MELQTYLYIAGVALIIQYIIFAAALRQEQDEDKPAFKKQWMYWAMAIPFGMWILLIVYLALSPTYDTHDQEE